MSEQEIEQEITGFRKELRNYHLSSDEVEDYVKLKKMLLMADNMPKKELLRRAKKIKPLVRVRCDEFCEYEKVFDCNDSTDLLVFTKFYDISASYLYSYQDERNIVCHFKKPLVADGLKKIGEFVCYHRFSDDVDEIYPCAEEVLRQIPDCFNINRIDAFELLFESVDPCEIYDPLLARYESKVVLYALIDGLPQQIKIQPIIYDSEFYKVNQV